jgi:hypothetical protein
MEVGAVRQVTWSGALIRKICGRTARIGTLGFAPGGFALAADFAKAGFTISEGGPPDVLCVSAACAPGEIFAHVRTGMLVVVDSGSGALALEAMLERSGLQPGRDVFLCRALQGNPLVICGATAECAKLGALLYLQVVASVTPSVRHRVDEVVDFDPHSQR